jgi:hypothetical protein
VSEPEPPAAEEAPAVAPTVAEPETASPENPAAEGTGRESDGAKPGGIVAQVVGTTSFFAALILYMGWNYDNRLLQQFLIQSPQSIGLSTTDFAATGIAPLFESNATFFAAVLVAVILLTARAVGRLPEKERGRLAGIGSSPGRLFWGGLALTAIMLALTWPQVFSGRFTGWLGGHVDGIYLAFVLLAGGQLLMAWPGRRSVAGQVAYPLALLVIVMLALWAGGVYAETLGYQSALNIEQHIPEQTAVTVYSAQPLDLSGPGVACARAQPGSGYPYECTGLRLLYLQGGTYYLLAQGWTAENRRTYILDDSDQIRIELSPGCVPKNPARLC